LWLRLNRGLTRAAHTREHGFAGSPPQYGVGRHYKFVVTEWNIPITPSFVAQCHALLRGPAALPPVQQKPASLRHNTAQPSLQVCRCHEGHPDNAGFCSAGPRVFCGDPRHFRPFSKNPRVSATIRRSPTLQGIKEWTSRLARPLGLETRSGPRLAVRSVFFRTIEAVLRFTCKFYLLYKA